MAHCSDKRSQPKIAIERSIPCSKNGILTPAIPTRIPMVIEITNIEGTDNRIRFSVAVAQTPTAIAAKI